MQILITTLIKSEKNNTFQCGGHSNTSNKRKLERNNFAEYWTQCYWNMVRENKGNCQRLVLSLTWFLQTMLLW